MHYIALKTPYLTELSLDVEGSLTVGDAGEIAQAGTDTSQICRGAPRRAEKRATAGHAREHRGRAAAAAADEQPAQSSRAAQRHVQSDIDAAAASCDSECTVQLPLLATRDVTPSEPLTRTRSVQASTLSDALVIASRTLLAMLPIYAPVDVGPWHAHHP